uniref:Aminoglycoside phosphotransferase domain-containing protein n=1 Tax=Alexandrium catenella TaxID=2925 RepID=A0A7S1S975_ALECA|mmetsp:Transcript_91678/g.243600  ORF Transcript_91678/g.243600 Transcript_91678/m.243600 type:complete len:231 (+) Transcript_91678:1-693(+)
MGADFVSSIGKALFPPECTTDDFMYKYKVLLGKFNSYTAEARYWMHRDKDYVAWTHTNLNVDNVFFTRDKKGQLDAGVLDWGGVTCASLGGNFWWWLYCCEYDFLTAHIDGLLQYFIDIYREQCGISLSLQELKLQFIFSALLQAIGVLGAVPLIYRMCSKKEWRTITERTDPRIYADVNGTGNLRVYIGTFINVVRMIHDWGIEEVIDNWIEEFTSVTGIPKKKGYKPS